MWFGPINEETYVHICDRARQLSFWKDGWPVTVMNQQKLETTRDRPGQRARAVCGLLTEIFFHPLGRGG